MMKSEQMKSLVEVFKEQQFDVMAKAINDAHKSGIVEFEMTDPVLIVEANTDEVKLRQSARLVWKGAERIEELEVENAFLKKLNADLHSSLKGFYEKTKPNTFMRNPNG